MHSHTTLQYINFSIDNHFVEEKKQATTETEVSVCFRRTATGTRTLPILPAQDISQVCPEAKHINLEVKS